MGSQASHFEESSTGNDTESDQEMPFVPLPETITISRKSFDTHMRGHPFTSWEELVRALPGGVAPQGVSSTSVKCDPMHVFAWVATFLIQVCIWGLVGYFSWQDFIVGIVLTSVYGVILWLCIGYVPPQMAGMLWPNLPVIIGAIGFQATLNVRADHDQEFAAKLLLFTIAPATASAAVFMRKLPEDPDRAVLVTNLFVGLWSGIVAFAGLFAPPTEFLFYFAHASLLLLGAAGIGIAALLLRFPGKWGSVELVTWTMNVGALAVLIGTCGVLFGPETVGGAIEPLCWVPFSAVMAGLALVGLRLDRTFPVLLSALGLVSVCIRISIAVGTLTESFIAGTCTFGGCGIAVVVAAKLFLQAGGHAAGGRDVYS